ncbi:MAG: cytochrome c [Sphingobacteriales bacterium]|nr:cytochrome c [Sphingobacteriales bacterium]
MRRLVLYSLVSFVLVCVITSCKNEQELAFGRYFANGKVLYENHCQNCHSKEGQGLGLLIPPLTDTVFLKANKKELGCFIRFGLKKEIKINNTVYNENMPADDHLSDMDIAQILVYVTNSFGNNQGYYSVLEANTDLKNCK